MTSSFSQALKVRGRKPLPLRGGRKKMGGGGRGHGGSKFGSPIQTKGARSLTKLELLPAIRGYTRAMEATERDRVGAEQGLYGLGDRTGAAVAGAYNSLSGSANQNSAKMQALGDQLNQRQSQINQETAQNLQGMQTGQLGGIAEALKARNVDPGGSASQAALAQQATSQQQTAARNAQAQSAFASAQGGAFQGLASGLGAAGQMRGAEAQTDLRTMIANRIAESNQAHRESSADLLGKRSDTAALYGPSYIKNLLQLRESDRQYDLAANPPTKRNVNVYKGLNKKGGARAQIAIAKIYANAQAQGANAQQIVAQIQQQTGLNHDAAMRAYARLTGGGGGGGKRKRRP